MSLLPIGNYYTARNDEGSVWVVKVTASRLPSFPPETIIQSFMVDNCIVDVIVFYTYEEQSMTKEHNVIEPEDLYVFKAKTNVPQPI